MKKRRSSHSFTVELCVGSNRITRQAPLIGLCTIAWATAPLSMAALPFSVMVSNESQQKSSLPTAHWTSVSSRATRLRMLRK